MDILFVSFKRYLTVLAFCVSTGCGVDNTNSNTQTLEVSGTCEIPNVPYGAPIVKVKFQVLENGSIQDIKISQSSGFNSIDELVLKSIDTCRYAPEIINSKSKSIWVERTYTWTQNIANK